LINSNFFLLDWFQTGQETPIRGKNVAIVVSSFEGLTLNSGIGTMYAALTELLLQSDNKVNRINLIFYFFIQQK
jgi:hypothetical protein